MAGAEARSALERARDAVCALIGGDPEGVILTSGGTEANNTIIRGACSKRSRTIVITSAAEHPSVAQPAGEAWSHVEVPVSREGLLDPAAVAAALPFNGPPPVVALGWVNGETGVVQPVHDIADAVRRRRPDAIILLDAAQAVGRLRADTTPCDFMSFSGHKLHGPAGTGVLLMSDPDDERLFPLMLGGGQERGLRSGTQNVAGAVGLGFALSERAAHLDVAIHAMEVLRDSFETFLCATSLVAEDAGGDQVALADLLGHRNSPGRLMWLDGDSVDAAASAARSAYGQEGVSVSLLGATRTMTVPPLPPDRWLAMHFERIRRGR